MGNIGDAFTGMSVPAVGTAGTAYASSINAILTEVMTRLSTKVNLTSIEAANADLNMNSNYAVTNALYLGMATLGSAPSGAPFGRFARYNGNVYYVDSYGTVQMTNGSRLNFTSTGGIGGDYGVGGNPAAVNYVDGTSLYEFYDDPSSTSWAGLKANHIDLVGTGTFRTRVDARATADWTMNLPANDPASGRSLLSMDNSGNVDHDQTISNSPTFSADIILSGTAKIQHGARTIIIPATLDRIIGPAVTGVLPAEDNAGLLSSGGAGSFYIGIEAVPVGSRITAVTARMFRSATAGTARVQLFTLTHGPTVSGTIASVGVEGTSAATSSAVAVTQSGLTTTTAAGTGYYVKVTIPTTNDRLFQVEVTYDQPA